jgi:DNA mismatch repair protein MutS
VVILDEIGRGTATYDGLSIAWATVEYLHNTNRCRALFATHYHELTALSPRLPCLECHSLQVKEWKGDVIFMHRVAHGTADRSYGVHVAKLAGLPKTVIERAESVLAALEKSEGQKLTLGDDLPLFSLQHEANQNIPQKPTANERLITELQNLELDNMSPRQALELLYELKRNAFSSNA